MPELGQDTSCLTSCNVFHTRLSHCDYRSVNSNDVKDATSLQKPSLMHEGNPRSIYGIRIVPQRLSAKIHENRRVKWTPSAHSLFALNGAEQFAFYL